MANRIRGRGKQAGAISASVAALLLSAAVAHADPRPIADLFIDQLRIINPTLTGAGVPIAQAEASGYFNPNDPDGSLGLPYDPQYDLNSFEVNPNSTDAHFNPGVTITYTGTTPSGAGNTQVGFPNSAGSESIHADQVAGDFMGSDGAAPGVTALYNYNADWFINNIIVHNTAIPAKVLNQSFAFGPDDGSTVSIQVDQFYDNYVVQNREVILTAVGNDGHISVPATAYNVISIGAYGTVPGSYLTGIGPTSDGRSKPDVVVGPHDIPATSFATGWATGATTLLYQAAQANIGGGGVTNSTDPRTIKVLLLNAAVKPAGWTHTTTQPLDPQFGAGIINARDSYLTLLAGKHNRSSSATGLIGFSHDPSFTGTAVPREGWNLRSTIAGIGMDTVDHYVFNVTAPASSYTLTATLNWYRPQGTVDFLHGTMQITSPDDLDLFLYNLDTGNLVSSSQSTIDNVEHLFSQNLPSGHYDLQVLLHGSITSTTSDTYALAYHFFANPSALPGDANNDGKVDIFDLNILAANWQGVGTDVIQGDFNGDRLTNIADLNILATNWQAGIGTGSESFADVLTLFPALSGSSTSSSGTSAAPEPASLSLLALASTLLLRRKNTRH